MTERMVVELTTGTRIIFEGAEQISSFNNALEQLARVGMEDLVTITNVAGHEVKFFTNHVVAATREKESAE